MASSTLCSLSHNLFSILDIYSLVGFAVKLSALQVEVAAGAVSIDGLDGGLDAGGSR